MGLVVQQNPGGVVKIVQGTQTQVVTAGVAQTSAGAFSPPAGTGLIHVTSNVMDGTALPDGTIGQLLSGKTAAPPSWTDRYKVTGALDFVTDCGADPTGVVDCAGAWDIAYAKLSALAANPHLAATSAVLYLPPGAYTLKSNPVVSTWNFQNLTTTLIIRGAGQDTTLFQFSGFDLPQFANMFSLFVSDISFVGTTASYLIPDGNNLIGANCSNSIVFERVKFYNLAATTSFLTLSASQTIVSRDCQIAACGVTTNAKAMVVIDSPQICLFENFVTLDIGLLNGFAAVGKDNANFKELLVIGGASQLDGLVTFSHCFWDESTTASVTIQGDSSNPMPRVVFEQCYWNPSTASGPMIDASYVDVLEVNGGIDSNFHAADSALVVNAVACNTVRIRKMRIVNSEPGLSHVVAADSATKAVIVEDSPGLVVTPAAPASTLVTFIDSGVTADQATASATVVAGGLLRRTATGGAATVAHVATTGSVVDVIGVSLDAAASTATLRSARVGQRLLVLNDGAGAIAVGDAVTISGATAGRCKKTTSVSATGLIGYAMTPAAATPDATFYVMFLPAPASSIAAGTAGQVFVTNATPAAAFTSLINYDTTHGTFSAGGGGSDFYASIGPLTGNETSYSALWLLANGVARTSGNPALYADGGSVFLGAVSGSGTIGLTAAGNYIAALRFDFFRLGGNTTAAPICYDFSTTATPIMQGGTASTSLTVGTNKSGATLILQADAASTALTLAGTTAVTASIGSPATGFTLNWSSAASGAGGTTTISGQNAGGTANNGGTVNINGGAPTTTGLTGLVQLQSNGLTMLGVGQYGAAFAVATVAIVAGTTTLTATQYQCPYIVLTGAIGGGAASVVFPNNPGLWLVDASQVSGASTIVFKSGTATASSITTPVAGTNQVFIVSTLRGPNTIDIK